MISWVVMLVSRLLDYVANIEDEASGGKKHPGGKERERTLTGISIAQFPFKSTESYNLQVFFSCKTLPFEGLTFKEKKHILLGFNYLINKLFMKLLYFMPLRS